jgi:N-acetyl sugar amidotransferase
MVTSEHDPLYRRCSVSVLDNIADPDITFDENGISNYYYEYQQLKSKYLFTGEEGQIKLEHLIDKIKTEGKDKQYDCITGISGGVDSTYLVYLLKQWGLRPLIVHFDNGWNSEISVRNINNIIKHTGFDLYTLVVNWNEFRDLQLSYIKASVVDIEVPTDHAIGGTLNKLAVKYNIRYILSGNNIVTEAILPSTWIYNKNDYVNLLNIHKRFGTVPLKTYPVYGLKEQYLAGKVKKIETVKPLNFIEYNKAEAKETIKKELEWTDYGGKHYESVFTKFYQAYILPQKFHIDKRKAHLSTLIFSGQVTKDEALKELAQLLYNPIELERDIEYVIKKFGLTREQFDAYMRQPRVDHAAYGQIKSLTENNFILRKLKHAFEYFVK